MKGKKINIILITAVILIWSVIIMRFVNFGKPPEPNENPAFNNKTYDTDHIEDTVILLLDYPDPFIKQVSVQQKAIPAKKTIQKKAGPKKENINAVQWPKIIYGGMISQPEDDNGVGIFVVDNKKFICCRSDSAGLVMVQRITSDTLYISYNNTVKGIAKTIVK